MILGMIVVSNLNVFASPSAAPAEKEQVQTKDVNSKDPLELIEKEMKSDEATGIAINVMSPGLKIAYIVLIILGIILIVGSVGSLAVVFIKSIVGKGKVTKSHVGLACAGLLLGVLLIGGTWFGIIKFAKRVGVDPVNNQIITQDKQDK